jgi:hypothetical protein
MSLSMCAELECLRGGEATLAMAEVVQLEVALLNYNEGAPLAAETIAFMDGHGFVRAAEWNKPRSDRRFVCKKKLEPAARLFPLPYEQLGHLLKRRSSAIFSGRHFSFCGTAVAVTLRCNIGLADSLDPECCLTHLNSSYFLSWSIASTA